MVFYVAIFVASSVALLGALAPGRFAQVAGLLLGWTAEKFGWFYLISAFGFLLFSLYLAFSRHGRIRLGKDDDEPEFSNGTWFAMLFSAGMGIGLVFWGVAEPLSHYVEPPLGAEPRSTEAARLAMRYSFFHWGLHAWAIYTVIGLCIAYFNFRKGYSGLISSTFTPLLGERVRGPLGQGIDVLAILATVFGVATSLGLGTLQINGGLNFLFGMPNRVAVQLGIIAVVTVLYMVSAATGLERGIKVLSNSNLAVAVLLLVFTLLVGPTSFIFEVFTTTLGDYLQGLVEMSLRLTPFSGRTWTREWTLFYWAWWIAWAPFVGMFIARVSRGRTIREFVLGVLLMPSLFSFLWFAVFGGTGLKLEIFDHRPLADAVQADVTSALFLTLQQLPLGEIAAGLATALIITFFVTSADSATFVLGMLSSGGNLHPTTTRKLVWGILQSSIAAVLLLAGGLQGLQTASIVGAVPFSIVMVLMCFSLVRALGDEERASRRRETAGRSAAAEP